MAFAPSVSASIATKTLVQCSRRTYSDLGTRAHLRQAHTSALDTAHPVWPLSRESAYCQRAHRSLAASAVRDRAQQGRHIDILTRLSPARPTLRRDSQQRQDTGTLSPTSSTLLFCKQRSRTLVTSPAAPASRGAGSSAPLRQQGI